MGDFISNSGKTGDQFSKIQQTLSRIPNLAQYSATRVDVSQKHISQVAFSCAQDTFTLLPL